MREREEAPEKERNGADQKNRKEIGADQKQVVKKVPTRKQVEK